MDLGDGRPYVRVPLTAIVESDVRGVAREVPFGVGQSVEVAIAGQYVANGISVHDDRLELPGVLVAQDEKTLTVMSPDGTQTLRYPAAGAHLAGTVVALDNEWLTLDLGDGRAHVRVPLAAILESKVAGSPQEAEGAVRHGTRVRLESSELGGRSVTGRVLEVDDESLVLRLPDRLEPLHLQRSSIRRMDVFLGKRNGGKTGATIGGSVVGVLGLAFGFLVGSLENWECGNHCDSLAPYRNAVIFAATGGLAGGVVGNLIGSTVETERWQAVPSKRLGVSVAPRPRGGLAASLSFRF